MCLRNFVPRILILIGFSAFLSACGVEPYNYTVPQSIANPGGRGSDWIDTRNTQTPAKLGQPQVVIQPSNGLSSETKVTANINLMPTGTFVTQVYTDSVLKISMTNQLFSNNGSGYLEMAELRNGSVATYSCSNPELGFSTTLFNGSQYQYVCLIGYRAFTRSVSFDVTIPNLGLTRTLSVDMNSFDGNDGFGSNTVDLSSILPRGKLGPLTITITPSRTVYSNRIFKGNSTITTRN